MRQGIHWVAGPLWLGRGRSCVLWIAAARGGRGTYGQLLAESPAPPPRYESIELTVTVDAIEAIQEKRRIL